MLRCLARGLLLLCAVLLLVPRGALACSLSVPSSWTKRTADGAFELSSRVGERSFGPATLSLREVRSDKKRWEHTLPEAPHEQQALLSPSGSYVALVNDFSAGFTVYGPGGEVQKLSLEPQLTAREKRKLPQASCGQQWVRAARFEGELLVLEVPTGGMVPPMYAQPQGTAVRFEPKTRQLTRDAPVPEKSTAELLQAYQGASEPPRRQWLAQELLERSMDGREGGDAALSRFWQELLRAPGTPPRLQAMAVRGLGAIGTQEEVRALARLPAGAPERDLDVLQVLEQRVPAEAEAFSLRVLEERREPELLRARALVFLGSRGEAVAERALPLALRDSSVGVREDALRTLARSPSRAKAVERALPFCQDAEARLRARAAESLLQLLRRAEGPERERAMALLRGAMKRGQLAGCPEGYVILAGVADLKKKRAEALALYREGVQGLEALPKERQWPTSDLRLEAKLQLAFEAKAQGQAAELKKWTEEVLGDAHKQTFVCAPKPNGYAGASPRTAAGAASSPRSTWPGSCSRVGPPGDEARRERPGSRRSPPPLPPSPSIGSGGKRSRRMPIRRHSGPEAHPPFSLCKRGAHLSGRVHARPSDLVPLDPSRAISGKCRCCLRPARTRTRAPQTPARCHSTAPSSDATPAWCGEHEVVSTAHGSSHLPIATWHRGEPLATDNHLCHSAKAAPRRGADFTACKLHPCPEPGPSGCSSSATA